jgi:hypothetical protein
MEDAMQKFVPALKIVLAASIGFLAVIVIVNLIFGNTAAAAQMLIPLTSGIFAFWFIGRANLATVKCPACAAQQPALRKPTSISQTLWGGWTCANCGTEIDRHGRPINDSPATR